MKGKKLKRFFKKWKSVKLIWWNGQKETKELGLCKGGLEIIEIRLEKISFLLCMFSPFLKKQGRIHGYPSRVRVGRGCVWGHFIILARAVSPMTAKKKNKQKTKKVKCDRPTDQRTNGPTKRGVESRSTRLKRERKITRWGRWRWREEDWRVKA